MNKLTFLFLFSLALGTAPAALAQAPLSPKTAAYRANQVKQRDQARATVAAFWAAARKGDTKTAQRYCVPSPDTEGLLQPQNSARLQRWANGLTSTNTGKFIREGNTDYIAFYYKWPNLRGGAALLYNPATGKIARIDQDAD